MNTQAAYQQYATVAQQNANYESTILWILFVLVVIAPLLLALIYIPIALAKQPKCPNCKSRKVKTTIEVTKTDDTTTKKVGHTCKRCQTEF